MSAPKKDDTTHTSGAIARRGLLTPQSSFLEDEPDQASASASLKRKSSSRDLDGDQVSRRSPGKRSRLEEITAALQPLKPHSQDLRARTPSLNRIKSDSHLPRIDPSTHLVWLDLETTDAGSPYQNIKILEIAVRITDKDFTPLDDGVSFLVHWPGKDTFAALEMIPPVVIAMHRKSRLQHDYDHTPVPDRKSLEHVEGLVCDYVKSHSIRSGAIMAGAGIGFDRNMIRHHMPEFNKLFHFQVFDTTTLWHLVSRKYGRERRFKGSGQHRAMDDINRAIREAKFYTDLVFKASSEVNWPSEDGI